jgi:hypothetical protein
MLERLKYMGRPKTAVPVRRQSGLLKGPSFARTLFGPIYAFVFSPSQDHWIARYIRDWLCYVDAIQHVAARIVSKIGCYDGFHVRRGNFWEAFTVNVTQINNAVSHHLYCI